MKPEEFLDAMGEIDPTYIEEAEEYQAKKKSRNWRRYTAVAAGVGLLVVGGSLLAERNDKEGSLSTGPLDSGLDAGAVNETEDGMQEETFGQSMIPETIYIDEDCYTRTDSEAEYDKETLSYVGELGDDTSRIHSDSDTLGAEVYRIDETRIMVEINGKYYTYKK